MSSFLARLKETAHTLDAAGRNKIVRLLVKDTLVDDDSIVIRHSIPVTPAPIAEPVQALEAGANERPGQCYVLRSGRHDALNAKDNFCFDRLISGWRSRSVLDLRHKG